jgi:hypothetical protein
MNRYANGQVLSVYKNYIFIVFNAWREDIYYYMHSITKEFWNLSQYCQ